MEDLGRVAEITGGDVTRVDPLELQKNFASVLEKSIVATRVSATFLLHKGLKFRNENDDTSKVMAKMKATPINDFMTKNGSIREDGRVMREVYVFRVKKPSESKGEWDLMTQIATIAPNDAFGPADKLACPLVK